MQNEFTRIVEPVYPGLEKLICAALADPAFAAALVIDAEQALSHSPHSLLLTPHERALACSVTDATDIHSYAALLHALTHRRESS